MKREPLFKRSFIFLLCGILTLAAVCAISHDLPVLHACFQLLAALVCFELLCFVVRRFFGDGPDDRRGGRPASPQTPPVPVEERELE